MCNNLLIFRIYLLLSITILLPICYFITIDLIQKITVFFVLTFSIKTLNVDQVSNNNVLLLFKHYIKQKQWLKCILMLEFYKLYTNYRVNNLLGICYQKLYFYRIARYYYIFALNDDPNNLTVLENLLFVCKALKDHTMIDKIGNQIRRSNQTKFR